MITADARVRAFVFREFRKEFFGTHLGQCPDLMVEQAEASDGQYGCDTGCEYATFEATLTCLHGLRTTYEYGTFGELAYILDELDEV